MASCLAWLLSYRDLATRYDYPIMVVLLYSDYWYTDWLLELRADRLCDIDIYALRRSWQQVFLKVVDRGNMQKSSFAMYIA